MLGIDVSTHMLGRARERARDARLANVDFVKADAQTHGFTPSDRDAMVSRFGVMFFADPVAAFANIARTLRPGGRMVFVTWAAPADNPWFRIPRQAAMARLGAVPQSEPTAPGPFAFQDTGRVIALLRAAGLGSVAAEAAEIMLTPPGTVAEAARFAGRFGPAAGIVRERGGTDADMEAIEAAIALELTFFETSGRVVLPGSFNVYRAARPE